MQTEFMAAGPGGGAGAASNSACRSATARRKAGSNRAKLAGNAGSFARRITWFKRTNSLASSK